MTDIFGNETIYFTKENADYGFLSNFYTPAPVMYAGIIYPSSEHAYQAQKGITHEDRIYVSQAPSPYQSKKRGNSFLTTDEAHKAWSKIKINHMFQIVHAKFMQNHELMAKLNDTGDMILVEYAPWGDTFWGVGSDYEGKNTLGMILMRVRSLIRRQESEALAYL